MAGVRFGWGGLPVVKPRRVGIKGHLNGSCSLFSQMKLNLWSRLIFPGFGKVNLVLSVMRVNCRVKGSQLDLEPDSLENLYMKISSKSNQRK